MKTIPLALGLALGALVLGGCVVEKVQPMMHTETTTTVALTATDQSLADAINAERRAAGLHELSIAGSLASMARSESATAATPAGLTHNDLHATMGSGARLLGTVKNRGPQSGATLVRYWMPGQRSVILGDWTTMGVGTASSPEGQLYGVVLFAR